MPKCTAMNYMDQNYVKYCMKLRRLLPLHLALLFFGTVFLLQPSLADNFHVKPDARDLAAIQKVIDAYQETWNRHDAHAFSLIFVRDAQFINVRGIDYPGGQAGIERAHRPLFVTMFKDSHVTTEREQMRFLRPDVVSADVYWRMTGSTDRAGKPRGLVRGLRTMVLTKEGSDWKIAIFHNMEIVGPAAATGGSSPPGNVAR